jgi:hypothetical protein
MKKLFLFLLLLPSSAIFAQELFETLPSDTLRSERSVLSTAIYQDDVKLSFGTIRGLYKENKAARNSYLAGKILQPLGPVISLAGLGLGYIGYKGRPASSDINYNNEDITVDYTIRSQPKLIGGLALFVGGFVLVETANDLIGRSVRKFNTTLHKQDSTAHRPSIHFGITPTGHVGLYASF